MRTASKARYRWSASGVCACAFLIVYVFTAPVASSSPSETANSAAAAAHAGAERVVPGPPAVPPAPEVVPPTPEVPPPPKAIPKTPPVAAPETGHSSPGAAPPTPDLPAPRHPSGPAATVPGTGHHSAQPSVRNEGSSNSAPSTNSKRSLPPPTASSKPSSSPPAVPTTTAEGRQARGHPGHLASPGPSIGQAEVASLGRWISRVWSAVAVLFPSHGGAGEIAAARDGRPLLNLDISRALSPLRMLTQAISSSVPLSAAKSPSSSEDSKISQLTGPSLTPSPENGLLILMSVLVALLTLFMVAGLNGHFSSSPRK